MYVLFCLSQIILNFEPTFMNQEISPKNLDFWFLLKSSEALTTPETLFLHGTHEQELAQTTSYCLTLGGLQLDLLPPGPNRYLSLQLLLRSLCSLLLPSELHWIFFVSFGSYLLHRFRKISERQKTKFKTNKSHLYITFSMKENIILFSFLSV